MTRRAAPRRVLHLVTTLDRGGAEKALLHLCRSFTEGGRGDRWRVSVGFLKGEGELAPDFEALGCAVHRLGLEGLRGAGAHARCRRLLRDLDPAVVHTHLFKADCLGAAAVGPRRPERSVLVSTKHNEDAYLAAGGPTGAAIRAVARRVAARADAVVAITDGVARFVEGTLGIGGVRTLRYGVPEPDAPPAEARARLRRAWGVSDDAVVALCIARFVEQKDHATLLDALRRAGGGVHLVLLGRGPLETELRRAAQGLPVTFAGFADDPAPAYAACDLVVLSSRHEGLGLVLVEAAQHGRAVVATCVGGIPEVVEDGVTGVLVPPGDADALAAAMRRVAGDATLRTRMGDAGRALARERFAPERQAREVESLYLELLGVGA